LHWIAVNTLLEKKMVSNSKVPTVLITGYRGFTGSYLAKALRLKGYAVYGLVRDKPMTEVEHQADLSNVDSIVDVLKKTQPDYFIHLAAVTFVAHESANDFYNTNLFGTLNLLDAIQLAGLQPKKVIIASSANVYGNPGQAVIDEAVQPLPINHYANSKLAMENMVRLWFDRLPIIITRPFNYTGAGQTKNFLIPKIVEHFKRNSPVIYLGNLDVVRDISDINFVVESYIRLLDHSAHSEIVNICSGKGYSIKSILEMMTRIAGYEIQVKVDPILVRGNEIKELIGSNKKLHQLVGDFDSMILSNTLLRMYDH
jgi:nucleoside-diphosphate-sugar epimerase